MAPSDQPKSESPRQFSARARPKIGWREWVALPALNVPFIKAKVDTGARSSSLHAYDVRILRRGDVEVVRFSIHPIQRDMATRIEAEAVLIDQRWVTSSSGHKTLRPVIITDIEMFGRRFPIELTLINRDAMGFRMLLGREALRKRFVVDPGRSYMGGRRLRDGGAGASPESRASRTSRDASRSRGEDKSRKARKSNG